MKIINVESLRGTERDVPCPNEGFRSLRLLLDSDGMGYTITNTTIFSGKGPQFWHYRSHLETCYCIEGHGVLRNAVTGEEFQITPGVAYVLDKNDPHTFEALVETKLICVFNPPLKGREVHKKDGSYE